MLTVEEVREAVKASPFYEMWGNEKDLDEIINRIKEHLDPLSLYNYNSSDEMGKGYEDMSDILRFFLNHEL